MDPTLLAGMLAVITGLTGAVGVLWRSMLKFQQNEVRCTKSLAVVSAQMWALSAQVEQMRGQEAVALVVIDANTGVVVEWGPGTTMMLHWPAREMLGKMITRIIPERFRQKHSEAMEKLKATGGMPRHGPFEFIALTKEGTEVPVEVSLSGWAINTQRFFGATIRPRLQEMNGTETLIEEGDENEGPHRR